MIARPRKPEEISPWDRVISLNSSLGQTVLHIGYRVDRDGIAWIGIISPFGEEGVAMPADWWSEISAVVDDLKERK